MGSVLVRLGLRRPNKWERPTPLDILISLSPLAVVVGWIYRLLLFLQGAPYRCLRPAIRVVCISDTHEKDASSATDGAAAAASGSEIPDGDLLIHAGDLTSSGSAAAVQRQLDWIAALPHAHKVVVAGNHDSWFDVDSRLEADREPGAKGVVFDKSMGMHYLQRSGVRLEFHDGRRSVFVWGMPDIPACGGPDNAFQYRRPDEDGAREAEKRWKGRVPAETDVLITHTPPRFHLDLTLGCPALLDELWRVRPRLHVFGHVHWGAGREVAYFDGAQRAYESLLARRTTQSGAGAVVVGGLVGDLLPGPHWIDALHVVGYGVLAVVWKWIMLGPGGGSGSVLVNAALMRGNTGRLGNKVQVVDI